MTSGTGDDRNALRDRVSDDPDSGRAGDVASRIAQRSLAKRGAGYTGEVRRLLDAALDVMKRRGTASRPRVADVVNAAGLSNDAFYRHFPSKDALVAALLEDGAERLYGYVAHQMAKEPAPEGKVRRWVQRITAFCLRAITRGHASSLRGPARPGKRGRASGRTWRSTGNAARTCESRTGGWSPVRPSRGFSRRGGSAPGR
jgi:AcrR family transcriptional regulator